MNLANKLTILRVLLVPVFMVSMYLGPQNDIFRYIALGIFLLAALTDWLDGFVARKYSLVSDFGKFADPLADKILMLAAFVVLVEQGIVAGWLIIIVLIREFIVTGIRTIAASKGSVIAASGGGKLKTVIQIVAISIAILLQKSMVADIAMYLNLIITVWSGTEYLMKNKAILKG